MTGETRRFKNILHVREVERDITQSELADKMREETSILSRLSTMEATRDRALNEFCSGRETTISPQQLWFERQSIDMLERTLEGGRQELADCRREIEATKGVLVERHRSVQLMEKHVDKLLKRDQKLMMTAEQNVLDDITSIRFLMSRRGGL